MVTHDIITARQPDFGQRDHWQAGMVGVAAMAAGITDRLWSLDDVIAKIDELAPAPKARGPYKKREK